jgi:predicted PurR-regulated permease PerM
MNERDPRSFDITHAILSVLFTGALIVGTFWVLRPFLLSLAWAGIVVVATWPAMVKLEARFGGRRGLAVALITVAMLLIVLIPMLLAVLTIIDNVDSIMDQVKALILGATSAPPAWVGKIPLVGKNLVERWENFASLSAAERVARVLPYARTALQWFAAKAGAFGMPIVHFLLTVIIAAILYAKGEAVREGTLKFARRLAGKQGEGAAVLAAKAVRGVVLGVVVTAVVQAALGGLGVFLTGVPAAPLLAAVMLILSLAQLGPLPVLVPSVIWLYWSGRPGAGTVLLVFSVVAGTVDNIIRPFLIKKGVDLPLLMIFAGVVGGLFAFGIIGLFIGPVVLAVTFTLLKVWVSGEGPGEETDSGTA